MKTRNGIRAEINSLYRSKIVSWLTDEINGNKAENLPVIIGLSAPVSDDDVLKNKEQFLDFCAQWHQKLPGGKVNFLEKTYAQIGTVEVPIQLVFEKVSDVASWAGHLVEYYSAVSRLEVIKRQIPDLIDAALDCIGFITSFEDNDFYRFVDVSKWLCKHRNSGYMIRQIPVRGADAAWFESHRSMLLRFLRDYLDLDPMRRDLRQLGLVPPKPLVQVFLLDHTLRNKVGGMRYFGATIDDLQNLDIKPNKVFFFEDQATAMTIPDLQGAVVIVAPSNYLGDLCRIEWISLSRCAFLGGIELRSFAMLNNIRVYLPNTESLLMDAETFIENRDLWTFDDVNASDLVPPQAVTAEEANLYNLLACGVFGSRARLRQDRMPLKLIYKAMGIVDSLDEELSSKDNAVVLKPVFKIAPDPLNSPLNEENNDEAKDEDGAKLDIDPKEPA